MTRFSIFAPLLLTLLLLPVTHADAARHVRPQPKSVPLETIAFAGHRVAGAAEEGSLRSAWTQLGPNGTLEARAVVEGAKCPEIVIDLHRSLMSERAAANGKFLTICTANIPSDARLVALVFIVPRATTPTGSPHSEPVRKWFEQETGIPIPKPNAPEIEWSRWRVALYGLEDKAKYDVVPLPLPILDPQRILVLGDTGCRIKGKDLQDCSSPAKWPFPTIAAAAARLKPDLVVHVGDYLYRENACPADFAGCAGTPFGDNWPAWDADFFAPAKPLLAAAPWVFVRGNHEDCKRAGAGWMRLLGPTRYDPSAPCAPHLAPYTLPLGSTDLVVMDDTDAADTAADEATVPVYRRELAALADAKAPSWLVMHKPIWAAVSGPLGVPIGGNLTLVTAAGTSGIASPVQLMVAGHVHSFEALNYAREPRVPPQVVAGFSGDLLYDTPRSLRGAIFQGDSGVRVTDGLSVGGFGFLLMTKLGDNWTIDVHDWQGRVERQCVFRAGRIDCPSKPR